MARTKQTARFSAQAVPRRAPIAPQGRRGRGRGKAVSAARSRSPSQQSIDVTHQQFSVKFDNQPDCERKAIKGTRFQCKRCNGYLNNHSELLKRKVPTKAPRSQSSKKNLSDAQKQEAKVNGTSLWVCEFCDTKNEVPPNIDIPKEDNPCYFLDSGTKRDKKEERGQKTILYCIDISGSMDTVYQGKSRLAAVKEAIRDQIKRMKFQGEKVKVGVITFGSAVQVKQKNKDHAIPSSTYYDFQAIAKSANSVRQFAYPIQTNFKYLEEMVKNIVTYGCTALGPGLVTSIELASKQRGSKVVLCTDGMANVGILGPQFYTRAANYAKEKGVMVSILSIKGDPCNLKELGKLSLSSGGSVLKINPTLLGGEFNKISKQNVFGTESSLRIIVNHFFEIENAVPDQISKEKTQLNQDFGNFTEDTELTFNFRILSNEEAAKKGVSMEIIKRKRLPMQVQLTYTNPQGERYLQIVNDHRQLTLDPSQVFADTNYALFTTSMLQKISKLIKDQKFGQAQAQIRRYKSLVEEVFSKKEKKADLQKFNGRINQLERVLNSKRFKKEGGKALMKGKIAQKKQKSTGIKKKAKSKPKTASKGKAVRGKKGMKEESSDSESESDAQAMLSDSEEEILWKELRARS